MLKYMLPENITLNKYKKVKSPVTKIRYLFALVSKKKSYLKNEEALLGLLDMIKGLEYHIKKIKRYEKSAQRWMVKFDAAYSSLERRSFNLCQSNHHMATHESVAYLNRVGQIAYYFQSKWFNKVVREDVIACTIPTILALMPIRNKLTSHRQIDSPRTDDCKNLGLHQYGLMHVLTGPIGKPEKALIEYSFPTFQRNNLLKKFHPDNVPDVEIFAGNNNKLLIFQPTKIHPTIIQEVINLINFF